MFSHILSSSYTHHLSPSPHIAKEPKLNTQHLKVKEINFNRHLNEQTVAGTVALQQEGSRCEPTDQLGLPVCISVRA